MAGTLVSLDSSSLVKLVVTPSRPRTLDAIHRASALSLRADLLAFVTYDERQAEAARRAGLAVVAP